MKKNITTTSSIYMRKNLNGAKGLDQLGQGAFQHHNVGRSLFQLIQAAQPRDAAAAAGAGAGGTGRS